jgi:hypothetical protein
VEALQDLPGVGRNLHDHPLTRVVYSTIRDSPAGLNKAERPRSQNSRRRGTNLTQAIYLATLTELAEILLPLLTIPAR